MPQVNEFSWLNLNFFLLVFLSLILIYLTFFHPRSSILLFKPMWLFELKYFF